MFVVFAVKGVNKSSYSSDVESSCSLSIPLCILYKIFSGEWNLHLQTLTPEPTTRPARGHTLLIGSWWSYVLYWLEPSILVPLLDHPGCCSVLDLQSRISSSTLTLTSRTLTEERSFQPGTSHSFILPKSLKSSKSLKKAVNRTCNNFHNAFWVLE